MKRRDFLKTLGLLGAAASLPLGLMDSFANDDDIPGFDPGGFYENFVHTSDFVDSELFQVVKGHLDPSLMATVPRRYWNRVEWFIIQPTPTDYDPFALRARVGWRYIPPGNNVIAREAINHERHI